MNNINNFSAGPSILPKEVFIEAASGILDYKKTGRSILEVSHRGPEFTGVLEETRALIRELMAVPDNYDILFLTGGASGQFYQVPMNILPEGGTAAFVDTGVWSSKAIKETEGYGKVDIIASGKEHHYNQLPHDFSIPEKASYLHMTSNNTIYGTQFREFPETETTLVCDMSSDIMGRPVRVSQFGIIYAGAQKNLGPAGVSLLIIRKDLLEAQHRHVPSFLSYKKVAEAGSMLNTPPVFPIYAMMLNLRWLKSFGGIDLVFNQNKEKARKIYDEIDRNSLFNCPVNENDRSIMNVVFDLIDENQTASFLDFAEKAGCVGLKGHRKRGGIRASIYNAMGMEGVEALIEVMQKFEKR